MRFQPLNAAVWTPTIHALHRAVFLIAPIQNLLSNKEPNALHHALFATPRGAASRVFTGGIRLRVDFIDGDLTVTRPSGETRFALSDHSQGSLIRALLADLRRDLLASTLGATPEADALDHMIDHLHARDRAPSLTPANLSDDHPLTIDHGVARAYAEAFNGVYTGLARWRARIGGHMTPIVLWAEHFDLATLWFPSDNPQMDVQQAHMSIGFSPTRRSSTTSPISTSIAFPTRMISRRPACHPRRFGMTRAGKALSFPIRQCARQRTRSLSSRRSPATSSRRCAQNCLANNGFYNWT